MSLKRLNRTSFFTFTLNFVLLCEVVLTKVPRTVVLPVFWVTKVPFCKDKGNVARDHFCFLTKTVHNKTSSKCGLRFLLVEEPMLVLRWALLFHYVIMCPGERRYLATVATIIMVLVASNATSPSLVYI